MVQVFSDIIYRLLRLKIPEVEGFIIENSNKRMEVLEKSGAPKDKLDAINLLGDQSNPKHNIFQESGPDDYVKTVAVGKCMHNC